MDLNGKTAIITGGASGLGEGAVRRFVGAGAKVAIFDRDEERGTALVEALGAHVHYFSVDVTDEAATQSAIEAVIAAFGGVHINCNFAGIARAAKTVGKDGPHPLDMFRQVLEVNVTGTFNVLRLAAAQMAKNDPVTEDGGRGVIINTASIAAYEGQMGQAAYSASKGAIVGMTLPIARDLAQIGIRCNTIVPGLIHTPMFEAMPTEVYDSLSNSVLYPRRLGKPGEIAHLAQYIVENDYTNGEAIRMDGGIRMQPR
ncbi:MAG: SDR family NAD(P)-dependent oxidoreductase [Pseudomonadota bacterium]